MEYQQGENAIVQIQNSVKAFYDENGNVDVGITEEDIICTKCYNHHLQILQNEDMKSRDSELAELLQSTSPEIEAGVHAHIISAGSIARHCRSNWVMS